MDAKIKLHSATPSGVQTIGEETTPSDRVRPVGNGVFLIIFKNFALKEPIPAEPLPAKDAAAEERRDLADALDALNEPDGASWAEIKKKHRL